jgi:hypothetical protein
VCALEGHARHDLLALTDLAGGGIVRVRRHAGEVGGEERLAIGAEGDAVVGLGQKVLGSSVGGD